MKGNTVLIKIMKLKMGIIQTKISQLGRSMIKIEPICQL